MNEEKKIGIAFKGNWLSHNSCNKVCSEFIGAYVTAKGWRFTIDTKVLG